MAIISTPILVVDRDDAMLFSSVEDAERYVEAYDVEQGTYRGWDGTCQPLTFVVSGKHVRLVANEASAHAREECARHLTCFLTACGEVVPDGATHETLFSLATTYAYRGPGGILGALIGRRRKKTK